MSAAPASGPNGPNQPSSTPGAPIHGSEMLDQSVRQFLAALASKTPTPGGGSVAALAGALAASLAEMAIQYTVGKAQFAEHLAELGECVEKLRKASGLLQDLVQEDMAAYEMLAMLLKMPQEKRKEDPRWLPALLASLRAPESVGGVAMYILDVCDQLLGKISPALLSDLGIAAALAHATVHAADLNVLVNVRLLPDREDAEHFRRRMYDLALKSDVRWRHIREHMQEALALPATL